MFTCLHLNTQQRITSISRRWRGRDDELRKLGRSDNLRCPYCKEPLTFRHGAKTRPHFAHRQTSECPLDSDRSAEETEAKAILFERLEEQLGDDVALDVLLENETRTIDILVSSQGKPLHAYWLMSQNRRQMEQFLHPATSRDIPHQIIYTQSKHHIVNDQLKLPKPQRESIQYSEKFDDFSKHSAKNLGHLMFLQATPARIRIYRGLTGGYHSLHTFEILRRNPLTDLIVQQDGELITREDLTEMEQRRARRKQRKKEQQQNKDRRKNLEQQRKQKQLQQDEEEQQRGRLKKQQSKESKQFRWELKQQAEDEFKIAQIRQKNRQWENKFRTCTYCHQSKTQWSIQQPNGKCVCTACLAQHNSQQANASFDFADTDEPPHDQSSAASHDQQPLLTKETYTCEYCGRHTSEWSRCKPGKKTCICHHCLETHNQSIKW